MTTQDLCGTQDENLEVYKLSPFVDEVMSLQFDEEPNYNKLKFLLTKSLLDSGYVPDKHYDWNKGFTIVRSDTESLVNSYSNPNILNSLNISNSIFAIRES